MKAKDRPKTVRRSVALPRSLVDEVVALAPTGTRTNLNRIVTVALKEHAARLKARRFEAAMACMAADPEIRRQSARIAQVFTPSEKDGLADD